MAQAITMTPQGLQVPNNPIIPFIEGDGIGPDIWAASVRVFDAAIAKAWPQADCLFSMLEDGGSSASDTGPLHRAVGRRHGHPARHRGGDRPPGTA